MNDSDNLNISNKPQNLKDTLYKYAEEGFHLFPVGRDKKPYTKHGFKDATCTQQGINDFLKQYPGSQWAGWFPRQFIPDIDVKRVNGFESLARLEAKYEKLPQTRTHKTGSGGRHYLYRQPPGYDIPKADPISQEYPGVDLQANDCYIVLPPSSNEAGTYEVIDDSPITDAPIWLCDFALECKKYKVITGQSTTTAGPIPMGEQQLWIVKQIRSYQAKGSSEEATVNKIITDIADRCIDQDPKDPFTEEWVRKKVQYCYTHQLPDNPDYHGSNGHKQNYPYTDMGNAERLFNKFGDTFRWVTERQRFIIWNNHVWEYDTPDHTNMMKLGKLTVRDIVNEPDGPGDNGFKDKIKHALSSESGKRQREMISLVKPEGSITVSINDLDKDIYLFNCRNATIDLRTGLARPQNKEDLLTISAPVDFDLSAKCPKWLEFLTLIQSGSQDMITYLQKISGYCMTGDTKTDIIPFCHGIGGNGKSTYWSVIRDKIMGPYAYEVDPDVFLVNNQKFKDSGQREELANLFGKRLVTATEIQEGRQLTINLLKAISGGESIHGDRKYEHGITYKPTFKVILSGNNEPIIKDNTNGPWRRLKKIPFTVTIQNQIDGFENTLNDELSGILNWLIEGCLLWQKEGLKDPQEVIDATAEYRKDQDLIAQFLDDYCIRSFEEEITKKDFKSAYQKWCTDASIKAMGDKELKQRLQVFGIKDGFNSAKTARVWNGVRLKTLTDTSDTLDSKNLKLPHEDGNRKRSMETPVRSCPVEANYGQDKKESGESGESSNELPDCPKCGKWDWKIDFENKPYCSCGYKLEAGL